MITNVHDARVTVAKRKNLKSEQDDETSDDETRK